jgi:RecA-family ATPase
VSLDSPAPSGLVPSPLNFGLESVDEILSREQSFVMLGVPCGNVTGVFGHGGSGKSSIELHRAVCIALGRPFFGIPTEQRNVLFVACEDSKDVVLRRLARICAQEGVDFDDLACVLEIIILTGRNSILYRIDPETGEYQTPEYHALAKSIKKFETEVVFIDGIADTFGGNENDKVQVKQFINALARLVPQERGAVILIGHVSKAIAAAPGMHFTENYSGSAQWHNAARSRFSLRQETESRGDWKGAHANLTGRVLLELQKSNYGPIDLRMSFVWDDKAQLFVGEQILNTASPAVRAAQDSADKQALLEAGRSLMSKGNDIPAAKAGPKTSFHVLSTDPAFPAALMRLPDRRRFWRLLQELQNDQLVKIDKYISGARHTQERLIFS